MSIAPRSRSNSRAKSALSSKSQPVPGGILPSNESPFCKLKAPDEGAIRWTRGFWADRFAQCHKTTIPYLWEYLRDPKRCYSWSQMRIAAGLEQGVSGDEEIADEHGKVKPVGEGEARKNYFRGSRWNDEFIYKMLEAMAHVYIQTKDAELDKIMDEMADLIVRAQCPDGYIATQIQLSGLARFENIGNHELYCMGHMITAACAHYRATGKTALLEAAEKCADYLYVVFMPRDIKYAHFPYNPSIIMALVDLYRTVKRKKYLELADCFVGMRGSNPRPAGFIQIGNGGTDQTQDFVPLREEKEVVGHGVFFGYLYSGAADVYLENGDETLMVALERLWKNLTEKKSYVTACATPIRKGYSPRGHQVHEAAGIDYDLPNRPAYNETCANIAAAMWSYRMLAATGEEKYADYMERTFYNSFLSGQGIEGTSWFYVNVLRWFGKDSDFLWQDMPKRRDPGLGKQICCPSNVVRTSASIHTYAYSVSNDGLWVNLYGSNEFNGKLADGSPLKLRQKTDYPWDGHVEFKIVSAPGKKFALYLRIPDWAEGATIAVNGKALKLEVIPGSYVPVKRQWAAGDVVELNLPMRVRLIEGHYKIEATRNQVAVQRGPLVYCLESVDLPKNAHMWEIYLPRNVEFTPRYVPDLLGGVTVLEGEARHIPQKWDGEIYREFDRGEGKPIQIRLIPYYAWCNRGEAEMTVWMPVI